ncbi:hypothetical protein GX51_00694 [Blastomyces parvus]|uniref:Uncharacterized protein n=1 Tax=Blastomyces parvus TaxID=2060905 RepID=A0A2B7XKS0_9EURO|nr:hypothetical protein GX51_00694 [Blastomyces parvus]
MMWSFFKSEAYDKMVETMTLEAFMPDFSKVKKAEAAEKKMRLSKMILVMEVSDDEDFKTLTPHKHSGVATSLVKCKQVKISEEVLSSLNTSDKHLKVSLSECSSLESVQMAHVMVRHIQHFHLPDEMCLEDIVNGSVIMKINL